MRVTLVVCVAVCLLGCSRKPADEGRDASASSSADAEPTIVVGAKVPPGAAAVVKRYLSFTRCEDRIGVVLSPETNKAILGPFYAENKVTCGTLAIRTIDDPSTNPCSAAQVGDYCYVTAVVGNNETRWFDLKRTGPETFLVDWRSTVTYNPMTFLAFKTQRPATPTSFRVSGKLATYYNFGWRGSEKTHYSLDLSEDDSHESMYAYVPRSGPAGDALFAYLKDGRGHPLLLSVSHRPGQPNDMVDAKVIRMDWHQASGE